MAWLYLIFDNGNIWMFFRPYGEDTMKYMFLKGLSCWFCVAVLVCPIWAVEEYEVVDLGVGFRPVALNDSGMVVLNREAWESGPTTELYVWDGQQSNFLFGQAGWLVRSQINNNASIVSSFFLGGPGPYVSHYWNGGNLAATVSGDFMAINDNGQIVYIQSSDTSEMSYLREPNGNLIDLGNQEGRFIYGLAINDIGRITGATGNFDDLSDFAGFVWDQNNGLEELAPLTGDNFSCGVDINNSGQVVGWSSENHDEPYIDKHLVLWDQSGNVVDMGGEFMFLGTSVFMNDSAQIAGAFKLEGDDDFKSYFWDEETGFVLAQDLLADGSSWQVGGLWGINNQGQMIATAAFDGEYHAVLLTPVPEPGTLLLVSLGILTKRRIIGKRQSNT